MEEIHFKYIYGPVFSWRLGSSLGVDLLSQTDKICNFDCTYCQIGKNNHYTNERKLYIPTKEIIKEIKLLHNAPSTHIDHITFSGCGEPTLAINLGDAIKAIKDLRTEPVAVLTNAVLISRDDIRADLSLADYVIMKLDAFSQSSLEGINRPAPGTDFFDIVNGIKTFKKHFNGKTALQIMFVDANKNNALALAKIAKEINPDVVYINTPLRPSPLKPLSKDELLYIKKQFSGLNVISVYDNKTKNVEPISSDLDIKLRRGA